MASRLIVLHLLRGRVKKTWVPRGAETALTLYNITRGWVTHDEVRGPIHEMTLKAANHFCR